MGSAGASVHFRAPRLNAAELPADITCRFRCDEVEATVAVLDLSTTGCALAQPADAVIPPGSTLQSLQFLLGDRVIWSGEAVVAHGSNERMGCRFSGSVLDLQPLRLDATLEGRMALLAEQKRLLPGEWRAAVGDLRHSLDGLRAELQGIESAEAGDPIGSVEEQELFTGLLERWGTPFYRAVAALHAESRAFDARTREVGRAYATSALMPLLMACPLHRRAYEKPLGYAGDARMMELYCADRLTGEGLYGRFLHLVMQNYTLARAVRARQIVMGDAVRAAVAGEGSGPVRILAVAAGPAIELRQFLEDVPRLTRPVELILLDQDPLAHESAHRHLSRLLFERHHGLLPVTLQGLHFSVRQLLKPTTPEDIAVRDSLTDLDLVYSAGLYDYLPDLVAMRLTRLLYGRLRPGGRLLMGNLIETPDSTWMLDYVLGWPLLYRDDPAMLRLGASLAPAPARTGVTRDATGHCIFLDVTRTTEVTRTTPAPSA